MCAASRPAGMVTDSRQMQCTHARGYTAPSAPFCDCAELSRRRRVQDRCLLTVCLWSLCAATRFHVHEHQLCGPVSVVARVVHSCPHLIVRPVSVMQLWGLAYLKHHSLVTVGSAANRGRSGER